MKRLPAGRLLYSLGDLTVSVPLTVVSFFQLFFLTDVARIGPAAAGWSIAVTKLYDAVNDPVIGYLSDRLRTPWGRRRGPMLVASVPLGLSFALLWLVPPLGPAALAVYYTVVFCLFDTCFTLYHVSFNSLTPEIARDYDDRSSLNGLRMSFSIAGALATVIALTVLGWFVTEPVRRFAIIGVALGAVCLLPPLAAFRGTRGYDRAPAAPEPGPAAPLADLKDVLGNRGYRQVLGLYLLSWTTTQLISGVLVYYASYYLRVPEQANYLVLAAEGSAILFIPLVVWLSRRLDKRRAFIAGCASWIAVQAGIALCRPGWTALVYGLAALIGFGIATAYVVPWSMLPDAMDGDRASTGRRREGTYYALASFFQKLGTGFALWMTAQLLSRFGYVTPTSAVPVPEQPASAVAAIRFVMGAVPAALLLGAVFFASRYGIGRAEHRAAAELIAGRQEA